MTWLLFPVLVALNILLTELASRALNPEKEEPQPCAHPWYIDMRCMVCGEPK